jgi:hypothetical protein
MVAAAKWKRPHLSGQIMIASTRVLAAVGTLSLSLMIIVMVLRNEWEPLMRPAAGQFRPPALPAFTARPTIASGTFRQVPGGSRVPECCSCTWAMDPGASRAVPPSSLDSPASTSAF